MDATTQRETLALLNAPAYQGRSVVEIAEDLSRRGLTADEWKAPLLAHIESQLRQEILAPEEFSKELMRLTLTARMVQAVLDGRPSVRIARLPAVVRLGLTWGLYFWAFVLWGWVGLVIVVVALLVIARLLRRTN